MTQPFRLPAGGRVNRAKPLRFTFDGRAYVGFQGDTLASALLANGVHLMGRSFKYHRPRGVLGAGVDEPNALVEIDRGPGRRDPNRQATTVALYEGLIARSQNRWPSLAWDAGALNSLLAPLIPAGFYYKTFMWPRGAWARLYEPLIRRMAGLGRAPDAPDADRYALRYDHCETLIVGAGPAGLAAALAASDGGGRVILCDEGAELGGSLLSDPTARIEGQPAWDWLTLTLQALGERGNVILLPRATAFQYGARNMVSVAERLGDDTSETDEGGPRERLRYVRASQVILATGAHERPLVFAGNDRPGVMLASAAKTWTARYGVKVGTRVVALLAHDSGYAAAIDLARNGAAVTILDLRAAPPAHLLASAADRGCAVIAGAKPIGTWGRLRVRGVTVHLASGEDRAFAADVVLMAGGWTPAIHLFSQSRGQTVWEEAIQAYLPGEPVQAVRCAGACRGVFALDAALRDGDLAGAAAAGRAPSEPPPAAAASRMDLGAPLSDTQPGHGRGMAFVDFQNDVTVKDLRLAVREGFRSVEHIKRYTTNGMATDQGRTSNINAMAVAGSAMGVPARDVGATTFRAPYTPITFGTLAGYNRGALFDPVRTTPIHDWARDHGAVFEDVGLWKRARYFPRAGEDMDAAVNRECLTVRSAGGLFDASTLGKIEVVGPDAAAFMNRLYVNAWSKLEPGRCRYGVMLREDGFIHDDGVVGRIAADRFHVTTTTGGAPGVLHLMEDYLQTEFQDLRVWLTSTTEQWAVIAVQGPRARDILTPLVEDIDLSKEAFPHMAVRVGRICGVPTRLFRVSFTGELGFEVNVPSAFGRAVWEAIHAEAIRHEAGVYGTEAMHVLRAEKGFILVGQDTDGTVTPDDAGLAWTIGKAKRDFVGKRSLARQGIMAPGRKQLVGLRPITGASRLEEGAQILPTAHPAPYAAQGHVTSAYFSATLGGPIALALLRDGRARQGETVHVTGGADGTIACRVTDTVFYDPKGDRIDG